MPFLIALLLALICASCGDSESDARGPAAQHSKSSEIALAASKQGSLLAPGTEVDASLEPVYRAVESGDLELALGLLSAHAGRRGAEGMLLEARIAEMRGDAIAALRTVEAARRAFPAEGRVYATAAEIYTFMGRLDSAQSEIERGLRAAGRTPELERARGIYLISRPGGAVEGLASLLRALAVEPDLPFAQRALLEAYRLVAATRLREQQHLEALKLAGEGLKLAPMDLELSLVKADAYAAMGAPERSLKVYEELLGANYPVEDQAAQMAWRAGMTSLLVDDLEAALTLWLRARELGLPEGEFGSAEKIMIREAEACVRRGVESYALADWIGARELFERALLYEPGNLAAENHLAVTLAQLGDMPGAIGHWESVVELLRRESIEPPEPVHLNLARALHAEGLDQRARTVLERGLSEWPREDWDAETRELLAALE